MDYLETREALVREVRNRPKLGSRIWPYDEPARGEKPYDALPVSGAGRDRAGGLPPQRVSLAATTETQHLRGGCSRNLWDPAVMQCRAVSQASKSRGILETRHISKYLNLPLCLDICSADRFLLQVRNSTKTVPR